jgi:tRNA pseudouridine32 synthase / 23S rRNA pseudouridine746 synthase
MTPEELRARVVHRDPNILVFDKPAGLPVHSGPKGVPDLESMLGALAFGNREPPRLAHRLDADTSGCLVLGRHAKALTRLGRLFSSGRVAKTYWAVVEGAPPAPEGIIDLPLAKRVRRDGWTVEPDPDEGRPAVTEYRVLGSEGGLSWLELKPRTGRTHQIRVHCTASGFPILGDPFYGRPQPGLMLHLHSRAVEIPPLTPSRPAVRAIAEPPPHMLPALSALGFAPA